MQPPNITKFGQTFISYGSYHYNHINKLIHILCVPIIAATLFSALSFIPLNIQLFNINIGVSQIFIAFTLTYYASINIGFAFAFFLMIAGGALLWQSIFSGMQQNKFFIWVISIHIFAWILQFIGHGIFEKRKPALLDNCWQILNGPLFVTIEILDLVGIRSAEMEQWKMQIKKNVDEFHKKDRQN